MKLEMKPVGEIKVRLGLEPNGKVQKFFTNTCYRYMDKYVPKRDGNLRTVVDLQNNSITYEMPYASYQYYGERKDGTRKVKHYTTPGTGPYWDERMKSADIDKVIEEVYDYMRRRK